MSSLIFIILMVWFIMRVVKNQQNGTGKNDSKKVQGSSTTSGSVASRYRNSTSSGSSASRYRSSTSSVSDSSAKKSAYESAMTFQKAASDAGSGTSRPGSSSFGSGSGTSRSGSSTFGSGSGSTSGSISTTEYLEKKAKEDARDHAQEKRAEQARLHQETGGRMVGVRYYEWDSIPKGNRVVKCSYCGAENLISERCKPNRYTCYFCREILE